MNPGLPDNRRTLYSLDKGEGAAKNKLMQNKYNSHDLVGKVINWKLYKNTTKCCMHKPGSILDNEADYLIPIKRPDIVVFKKKKEIVLRILPFRQTT